MFFIVFLIILYTKVQNVLFNVLKDTKKYLMITLKIKNYKNRHEPDQISKLISDRKELALKAIFGVLYLILAYRSLFFNFLWAIR